MGDKDFFDDDLIQKRESLKEVKTASGKAPAYDTDIPVTETVPVHELHLTPLAKRKEAMNGEIADKLEKLERLRASQDAVERKKNELEHIRSNQEKYEAGKRELIDRLEQSLVSLEREEIMLNRRIKLIQGIQKSFKTMDEELRAVDESEWPEESGGHRDELTKGLALVESMRKEYQEALSRLDAVRDAVPSKARDTRDQQPWLNGEPLQNTDRRRTFGEWMLIGLAFNLFMVLALGALLVFMVLRYQIFFVP